jgi:signal transduction histidine kinase/CheY-like chemotaxis protein
MTWPVLRMGIAQESDVVAVRQRARQIAEILGFETQDQTRIATAASEIARNALTYGKGGNVEFALDKPDGAQSFLIQISDQGPGIADLDGILEGRHGSANGLGMAMVAARRLMDRFQAKTTPGKGTVVTLGKRLPRRKASLGQKQIGELVARLAHDTNYDPVREAGDQNRELLRSLAEERSRQEELARINSELQDTNRGVVALYAELDEQAARLRHASELKSRFLSNMSHEFRTPLNSILALSRLLLDHVDGGLNAEQNRQVEYIRKSAESLTELVNDLLDIAKVEAGKTEVRPVEFTVPDLFGGLRGALRPLRVTDAVDLVFDEANQIGPLYGDSAKIAQILRNFVSNALKFTERGAVKVSAFVDDEEHLVFRVQDTGVGIAPEHHLMVFQEFSQIENPLQGRVKGTGLGLPLSKKLAELMGGQVYLESELGVGSTFYLSLPLTRPPVDATVSAALPAATGRLLVIDDDATFRYVFQQMLGDSDYQLSEAVDGVEGLELVRNLRPDVIFLDLYMPRLDGYSVLQQVRAIPGYNPLIVVVTSSILGPVERTRLLQADLIVSKETLSRKTLLSLLPSAKVAGRREQRS